MPEALVSKSTNFTYLSGSVVSNLIHGLHRASSTDFTSKTTA